MSEVSSFFDNIDAKVDKSKAEGMNAIYQFVITGDDSGEWWVKLADGNVESAQGQAENPSITLTMAAEDFAALVNGDLNGQQAFLTGKLKIQGDMTLAMKLQTVFNLG